MGEELEIQVKCLPHFRGFELPSYRSSGSSGLDLQAAIDRPVTLDPGERLRIPTGLCVSIPEGFEAQIRPRSGLAFSQGLTVLNSPGTVDSDYRGEMQVVLINLGKERVTIKRGDRIAQAVFAPVIKASFKIQEELDVTTRNEGGFGHTGV